MPRRTRKQLVGKAEDRERRASERELAALLLVLRREWRGQLQPERRREAA